MEEENKKKNLTDRTMEFMGEDASGWNKENEEEQVIFNMNVEGMPGYRPDLDPKRKTQIPKQRRDELSGKETRQVIATAMLTALGVGLFFSAVIILFTLFCTQIWFR